METDDIETKGIYINHCEVDDRDGKNVQGTKGVRHILDEK